MLSTNTIQSEKGLLDLIERNFRKEIHPGTKPSIDFIKKILDEAYRDKVSYDLTDIRPRLLAFANNSSNQALACLKTVQSMKFKSGRRSRRAAGSGTWRYCTGQDRAGQQRSHRGSSTSRYIRTSSCLLEVRKAKTRPWSR